MFDQRGKIMEASVLHDDTVLNALKVMDKKNFTVFGHEPTFGEVKNPLFMTRSIIKIKPMSDEHYKPGNLPDKHLLAMSIFVMSCMCYVSLHTGCVTCFSL